MGRPTTTQRDRLHKLLAESGEPGIRLEDLPELGVHSALVHAESLKHEGHAIIVLSGEDPDTQRILRRIILSRDAWA